MGIGLRMGAVDDATGGDLKLHSKKQRLLCLFGSGGSVYVFV